MQELTVYETKKRDLRKYLQKLDTLCKSKFGLNDKYIYPVKNPYKTYPNVEQFKTRVMDDKPERTYLTTKTCKFISEAPTEIDTSGRYYKDVQNERECGLVNGVWDDKTLNRKNKYDIGVCWVDKQDKTCSDQLKYADMIRPARGKYNKDISKLVIDESSKCNKTPGCKWEQQTAYTYDCVKGDTGEKTSGPVMVPPENMPLEKFEEFLEEWYLKNKHGKVPETGVLKGRGDRCNGVNTDLDEDEDLLPPAPPELAEYISFRSLNPTSTKDIVLLKRYMTEDFFKTFKDQWQLRQKLGSSKYKTHVDKVLGGIDLMEKFYERMDQVQFESDYRAPNLKKTILTKMFLPSIPQSVVNMVMKNIALKKSKKRGMLAWHSTGSGKCHAKNTKILMFDGSIKLVQDIIVGDNIMGDDSTSRKVLSLGTGTDDMYDIIPIKGEKYTVNSEHILCLKHTVQTAVSIVKKQKNFPFKAAHIDNKTIKIKSKSFATKEEAKNYMESFSDEDKIVEVAVKDYLNIAKSLKKQLKGYRCGVEFPSKEVDIDPWIIGFWIGDGSKRDPVITTQDSKVIVFFKKELSKYGLILNYQSGYDYRISSNTPRGPNKLLQTLQKYNMINNKHIPDIYKINDKEKRLQILAGIIDSDGYLHENCYEIVQKSKRIADDILYLCRSLGFAAYSVETNKSCTYEGKKYTGLYQRISISGEGLENIPTKLTRKQAHARLQIKNALVSGIEVKHVGKGKYYGFTLDGNHRYLMGDFTCTHNTCTAAACIDAVWDTDKQIIFASSIDAIASNPPFKFHECVYNLFPRFQQSPFKGNDQAHSMALIAQAFKKKNIRFLSFAKLSNRVLKANEYKKLHKLSGGARVKVEKTHDDILAGDDYVDLDKCVLIIDEVQNLFLPISTQKKQHEYLEAELINVKKYPNLKVVIMTATPGDNVPDVLKLINIIRDHDVPEIKAPDIESKADIDRFKQQIRGMISYFDMSSDDTKFPIVKDSEAVKLPMSATQYEKYVEAYKAVKDIQKNYKALAKKNELRKYWEPARKYANMLFSMTKDMNLNDFSSKLPYVIENIQKYPEEKHYLYSAFYTKAGYGGHGVVALAKELEKVGYTKLTITEAKKLNKMKKLPPIGKRYILVINTELSETGDAGENLHELLKIYNHVENKDGQLIHIMLASNSFHTALDLKDVSQLHMLEPFITMASERQAIGRAVRYCAHSNKNRSKGEWVVKLHRYMSAKPDTLAFNNENIRKKIIDEITELEDAISNTGSKEALKDAKKLVKDKEKEIVKIEKLVAKGKASESDVNILKKELKELEGNLEEAEESMLNGKEEVAEFKLQLSSKKKELKKLDNPKNMTDNVENIEERIYEESKERFKELFTVYQCMRSAAVDCRLLHDFHTSTAKQNIICL